MNKKRRFPFPIVMVAVACGSLALSGIVHAAGGERILSYQSKIVVHEDSSMTVQETIKVRSAGRQIKRGIYRDFPTCYKDRSGNRYVVDFNVKRVLRDGRPEAYHFKGISNGKRVYIGRKNVFLPAGEYTYTIVYETNRQLGFFKDHDELYWNVTGTDWGFPIEKASATVILPPKIPRERVTVEGYTGPQGSRARNLTASIDDSGNPTFFTTKPLRPREGLTIVVTWPKGFVAEPTREERLGFFIRDNLNAIIGMAGLLAILSYYVFTWARVGKDPSEGTIIPLFAPPKGFSPAAMRYIVKMGYDNKCFSAAFINMAVKGFIRIKEDNGVYTIEKQRDEKSGLAPEEKKIASKLLSRRGEIELKQKNHSKIGRAVEALKKSLKIRFEKNYFITNTRYFVPGVILSVITIIMVSFFSHIQGNAPIVLFMSVWLSIWSVGVVFLSALVISSWKSVVVSRGSRKKYLGAAIAVSLFAIPFFAGEVFGLYILAFNTTLLVIVVMVAIVFINFLFYHLLKAPTRAGRKLLDKVEGFKMYLSVAEKERLNLLNPPEKTPELFERYLPYALALDVENVWAEQFSDVLARAGEAGREYSPSWYSGTSWSRFGAGGFASSLSGAFSSAVASSSTAPGSSSGSGGGGFSGGGGGGGGGGGW